jgi:hypothetical protein
MYVHPGTAVASVPSNASVTEVTAVSSACFHYKERLDFLVVARRDQLLIII